MKAVWAILVFVVAVGLVVWLQPPQGSRINPAARLDDVASIEAAVNETVARIPADPKPAEPPKDLATELLTARASAIGATPPTPPAADSNGTLLTDFRDGLDRAIKSATVTAGRFERKADGTLLADGRYLVRGNGTEEDPYVVPWDLLTSAMDTYAPRQGQTAIPQRVAMLDGKRVRIEGYFAFPLVSTEATQLIVTLNQWDGCCIGIPPTAYDAIEVTLGSSVSVQRRLHQIMFGSVEGTFRVEPYVMDQWLVGLYLLDDASLKLDL